MDFRLYDRLFNGGYLMSSHHEVSADTGYGQKTLSSYIVGLLLCVVLTLIAFGLVETRAVSDTCLYVSLAGLAIVQLLVQCVCFLRLNTSHEGKWNLLPFLFTIFIIAILVGGSLWIMYNLNYNMMN